MIRGNGMVCGYCEHMEHKKLRGAYYCNFKSCDVKFLNKACDLFVKKQKKKMVVSECISQ